MVHSVYHNSDPVDADIAADTCSATGIIYFTNTFRKHIRFALNVLKIKCIDGVNNVIPSILIRDCACLE